MLVSPSDHEVRWIVEQSLQRYFEIPEAELTDIIETPVLDSGRCIARCYRISNLLAMWLKDVGILQFYDDRGRMLRRANLFAEIEPRAAAA